MVDEKEDELAAKQAPDGKKKIIKIVGVSSVVFVIGFILIFALPFLLFVGMV